MGIDNSFLHKIGFKKVYIIVFAILAMWAFLAYFTVNGIIKEQQKYASLINISGKQRMLSQRTQLYAFRFLQTQDQKCLKTLEELLALMKKDHLHLMKSLPAEPLIRYYTVDPNLNKLTSEYFDALQSYIEDINFRKLEKIQKLSTELLPKLNEAVSLYEQQSDLVIQKLQLREYLILFGTLLTLLLEYIFLIRPISKIITQKTKQMKISLQNKEIKLDENLELIDTIFENTPIPLFYKNINGKYERVNSAFCITFGFKPEEILDKTIYDVAPKELADIYYAQDQELYLVPHVQQVYESKILNHKTKRYIDVRFYKQVIFNTMQEPIGLIGAVLDISATKAQIDDLELLNAQLKELSFHDPLTTLPNRRFLNKVFEQLGSSEQIVSKQKAAILILDIDDFKKFNDMFGHDIGDKVLQEFAQVIENTLRKGDIAGRWGGEEFLIVCPNTTEMQGKIVAEKICQAVRTMNLPGVNKNITVSIGISSIVFHDEDIKETIKKADKALYQAKKSGKNKYISYQET